jgi:hypothetical protein
MEASEPTVVEPKGYLMLMTTGGGTYVVRPHIARTVSDMLDVVNRVTGDDPTADPWVDCTQGRSCRWRFVEGMEERES